MKKTHTHNIKIVFVLFEFFYNDNRLVLKVEKINKGPLFLYTLIYT